MEISWKCETKGKGPGKTLAGYVINTVGSAGKSVFVKRNNSSWPKPRTASFSENMEKVIDNWDKTKHENPYFIR